MTRARVAVVGATGAVGTTMMELLRERAFPADEIVPFASERSAGTEIDGGRPSRRWTTTPTSRDRHRAVLGRRGTSRTWAPRFVEAGAMVIDNSSAFRKDPTCRWSSPRSTRRAQEPPRPHRQPQLLDDAADGGAGADPAAVGIERLVVSTYQLVSGTGKKAIDELDAQAHANLHGMDMPDARGLSRPDRVQRDRRRRELRRGRRPHRRGAQDDVRDAQDP